MKVKIWIFLVLAAVGVTAALAQTSSVRRWLDDRVGYYNRQGYVEVFRRVGDLDEGSTRNHYFSLVAGWEYRLVAVCDSDCDDIDLTLYDANGYQVDRDEGLDDLPLVSANPRYTDQYRLRVEMAACDLEPCEYAVAVVARRR